MDLSKLTFIELNKLYYQLGIEYFKRVWWLYLIALVIVIIYVSYKVKK